MNLTGYTLRRVTGSLPVILGLALVSFFLIHLVPGDPVRIMLGGKANAAEIAAIDHRLGLDKSLPQQFWDFAVHALHGNLGTSIILQEPVSTAIGQRLGPSILLLVYATVFAALIAFPLGVAAAVRHNEPADHTIRVLTLAGFAVPSFWLGVLLIRIFSLKLGWFPVSGYGSGVGGRIQSLTLPAATIGLFLGALLARSLRASLIEVLDSEYVEAARARGLSERRVIWRHALRNSMTATITVFAVNLGWLIGGAVVVEHIFAIPGLGSLLVQSIVTRDFPVIQALTLLFGVLVVGVNLLADVAYAVVDPRVQYA
jgi:peptide/nickel transport system permease protein